MTTLRLSHSALWFLASALLALGLNAAEIALEEEVQCRRSLVRLADVAVVTAEQPLLAERLNDAELFPAPPVDGWIRLDRQQLLELLEVRGFDPALIRLAGAEQTMIYGPREHAAHRQPARLGSGGVATKVPPQAAATTYAVSPQAAAATYDARRYSRPAGGLSRRAVAEADRSRIEAAADRVGQAIADYLRRTAGSHYAWQVQAEVAPQEAALLASGGLEIAGGSAPWTGRQSFRVRVHRAEGVTEHTLAAEVALPAKVVAAARPLAAGDVITPADLQLLVPAAGGQQRQTLEQPEQAIGREITRSLPAGQLLEADMLRAPIVVKRNQVATLQVRSGAVVVGTKVRAMDDGAAGDAVRVQSLFDRQQFVATVVGPQRLEIRAGAAERN